MTFAIGLVLGLLIVALVLFALELFSVDMVTLMLLIVLVLTRILTPDEVFSGFGQEIIIILAGIFIISGALMRTGVMDLVGASIHRVAGNDPQKLVLVVMLAVSLTSAFMNNTTATAVFIPAVLGLSKRSGVSPSKLLMPLAFGSILGGTCTLIGTSTNMAVSGYLQKTGMQPLGLFEFTPVGLLIVAVGIAYMVLIGHRFLPEHHGELTEEYHIKEYLTEILVPEGSPLVGQTVSESQFSRGLDLTILEIHRGKDRIAVPRAGTRFKANDTLLVEGPLEEVMKVRETTGIEIKADVRLQDHDLEGGKIQMVEVLLTPQCPLIDRSLKDVNFRWRYGISALAIYRHGQSLRDKVGKVPLQLGDVLLVQGPQDRIDFLRREPGFWILEDVSHFLFRKSKGLYTVSLFLLAVVAGGFGWLPLSIAILAATVLIILFKCVTVEEAYNMVDWRLIVLIGGMTAYGTAMDKTGAAQFLADGIVRWVAPLGLLPVLGAFFVLTALLTQPMSNAAAALVVLPVALKAAVALGAPPREFAIAVMLAASCSFVTPFEPSCILVYGPGRYRFTDFVKNGFVITILLFLVILYAVPRYWGME